MSKSKIEWTEQTWNPIVGCSIVSPGCTNCYAMKMAGRIEAMNIDARPGHGTARQYEGTTARINGNAVWTGKLARAPRETLRAPLKRKKPTTYFVNSMGDLFHDGCPDEWIDQVFAIMALCPQHTFQVLTKRAARMLDYCNRFKNHVTITSREGGYGLKQMAIEPGALTMGWPLPNVWLGVSTERQQEADERIPLLLRTPAARRFISAEPLLGFIDANLWMRTIPALDWVIVGGESGPSARPMHPGWARALRDQCNLARVPFFFKQWGTWHPRHDDDEREGIAETCLAINGAISRGDVLEGGGERPRWIAMDRVGKKRSGRLLYGREHNEMPRVAPI